MSPRSVDVEVAMPTHIPVRREPSVGLSVSIVCAHALLAAAIISMIVVTVIWAYR
jgi:hypothetical protein